MNADFDFEEHLPSPPEVIEIADNNEVNYSPPVNTLPLAKSELPSPLQVDPNIPPAPPKDTLHHSTRVCRPPDYLHDYLFTTVAEKQHQPPPPPYHTAGGTAVDLTIQDESVMAQICHYVMVHTATSLHLAAQGHPPKKQYSLKAGLCQFSERGDAAVMKELSQLHVLECFRLMNVHTLTREDHCNAPTSLMFLTERRSGEVKTCACANGSVQRTHVDKEEAVAPTVMSEAIFIQSTIFDHENRDVATCDILGAFLQADNPDYVLMQLDGVLAELMVKVEPKLYCKYTTTNAKGKPVLYVQLKKAVYGMMKSALLFYCKYIADLTSLGFDINPYDPCVTNKIINGKQITICWHVDDLLISHVDPAVVTHFLTWLAKCYDTADKKLNVVRGTKHDYLGMNMDFSSPSEVRFDMIPYIRKIISTLTEKITGVQSTPAGDRFFHVRPITEAQFLSEDLAWAFHHTTAQLLLLSRVR